MLLRKIFENLHTVIVILALFEQFSSTVCSYFWPLTLSPSSNMMHFVSTVSIITKVYCYEQRCKSMLSIGGDDLAKLTRLQSADVQFFAQHEVKTKKKSS